MLRRLRWQLTLLYLLAALGLVGLVGGGSYTLIRVYFDESTDLALEYKMATLFQLYQLPVPADLIAAENTWLERNAPENTGISQVQQFTPDINAARPPEGEVEEHLEGDGGDNEPAGSHHDESYDSRLASIFVLPLTADGVLVSNPNPAPPPITENGAARAAALSHGSDLRTTTLQDGTRVRLLTYRTPGGDAPAIFQVGRLLNDQDRLLNRLLSTLLILAAGSSVVLGAGSWWLSGRSMGPAQRAWDQQQAFVSNASHELRTPLTLIRATADYGLRRTQDPEQRQLLQDVLGETDYMNRLVDDLLLLSRLDSQRLKLDKEPIQARALLEDIRQKTQKVAANQDIRLILDEARGEFQGDPDRMRQLLLILLDNALRYTDKDGEIHLSAARHGSQVQISVQDNGIGIPAEHLPHLFERFYQVRNSTSSDENRSNGLGLSIARGLVEAQGGSIRIESEAGQGTRVIVSMPAEKGSAASPN